MRALKLAHTLGHPCAIFVAGADLGEQALEVVRDLRHAPAREVFQPAPEALVVPVQPVQPVLAVAARAGNRRF